MVEVNANPNQKEENVHELITNLYNEILYYYNDCKKKSSQQEAQSIIDRLAHISSQATKVIEDSDPDESDDWEGWAKVVHSLNNEQAHQFYQLILALEKEGQEFAKRVGDEQLKQAIKMPFSGQDPRMARVLNVLKLYPDVKRINYLAEPLKQQQLREAVKELNEKLWDAFLVGQVEFESTLIDIQKVEDLHKLLERFVA